MEAARRLEYKAREAEISYALGKLFDTCADSKEALTHLEDAVMAAEASRHDEVAIEAAAMLGSAYADLTHDARAARQWVRLAQAIATRFSGHPLLDAQVGACNAVVLSKEGRFDEALKEEQRVLAIRAVAVGPSSVDVAMSNNNLATFLHELGRDGEAVVYIRRAIDIFTKVLGEGNGRIAIASLNECEILTALRRYDEAEKSIRAAIDIWQSQQGSSFYVGAALLDLGKTQFARGDTRAAVGSFERSLAMLGTQDLHLTADAQFALAQALVTISRANLPRALDLSRSARDAFAGDASAALPRRIDAWQAATSSQRPAPRERP